MQAVAYEGYFKQGRFYTSGNEIQIPEERRVVITILDAPPVVDSAKQAAWNDFKRMVKKSAHENHLLTDDVFHRDNNSRDILNFENGDFA